MEVSPLFKELIEGKLIKMFTEATQMEEEIRGKIEFYWKYGKVYVRVPYAFNYMVMPILGNSWIELESIQKNLFAPGIDFIYNIKNNK